MIQYISQGVNLMKKTKIFKMKNGPKVVLYQDTSKHVAFASLYVMFGGDVKKAKIDGKEYKISNGIAHFIEHLLIEHSKYGNFLLDMEKKNTDCNGFTNKDRTEFYVNSVENFEDDLVKLINVVNNAHFTKKNIEEVRSAIIKEKMMEKDRNFVDLMRLDYSLLFKNFEYPNVLGEVDDIKNISYEDVKLCYDAFYRNENEVIVIAGNFNIGRIEKILKEKFGKKKHKYKNVELLKEKEGKEIANFTGSIKKNISMDYVRVTYKIDASSFKGKDRVDLDFYMYMFLSYLFDPSSDVYNDLVESKTCIYNLDYSSYFIEDYLIIMIGTTTDNHEAFIDKVVDTMKSKKVNEEDFELRKKDSIVEIILREDTLGKTINPFVNNILVYNYDKMDTTEDIESLTFEKYKNVIEGLDFSHYAISMMLKNGDKSE